ncbi:hypothetical protein L1887_24576 [Cichorium endivia]|nr:hypothetical protein L1887_24576 [Cichorium endivia]
MKKLGLHLLCVIIQKEGGRVIQKAIAVEKTVSDNLGLTVMILPNWGADNKSSSSLGCCILQRESKNEYRCIQREELQ